MTHPPIRRALVRPKREAKGIASLNHIIATIHSHEEAEGPTPWS